jgi:hypothetical protein
MIPASRAKGSPMRSMRFARGSVSPRPDATRVRRGKAQRPSGQAPCRAALQPARRALAADSARSRPIISNISTKTASPRWRARAPSRAAARRLLFHARDEAAAGRCACARPACRSRSPPTATPAPRRSLAAAGDEHGRDPVPPDRRRMHRRASPARPPARWACSARSARSKPASAATSRSGTSSEPAELVYRMGFNPLHARIWRGHGDITPRSPAPCRCADWRAIYRGATQARPRLPAGASPRALRTRSSGSSLRAIRSTASTPASGSSPASASRRRPRDAPAQHRPRHAAGVGAPSPVPVLRLMMALKLASLAQGASGVRPETLDLLEAMLSAA